MVLYGEFNGIMSLLKGKEVIMESEKLRLCGLCGLYYWADRVDYLETPKTTILVCKKCQEKLSRGVKESRS